MIIIGNKVFAIISLDDLPSTIMVKYWNGKIEEIINEGIKNKKPLSEQEIIDLKAKLAHVELGFLESKLVIYKPSNFTELALKEKLQLRESLITWWRISLNDAEIIYGSKARWVCPD